MDAAANDAANAAAGAGRNPFASLAASAPSSGAPAATSTGAPAASAAPAVPNTSPLPNPWAPAASQPLGGAALVIPDDLFSVTGVVSCMLTEPRVSEPKRSRCS